MAGFSPAISVWVRLVSSSWLVVPQRPKKKKDILLTKPRAKGISVIWGKAPQQHLNRFDKTNVQSASVSGLCSFEDALGLLPQR